MSVISSEEVAHMSAEDVEQMENEYSGYCEQCQVEYIGICSHYEIAQREAERFGAETREPSGLF